MKAILPRLHRFALVSLLRTLALLLAVAASPAIAATLEGVKSRDQLVCGVSNDVAGLAAFESPDVWSGIEPDFCRAVAAAVLGDGTKVRFRPLNNGDSFRALAAGEVDLLAGGPGWTLSRDTELKVRFVEVLLFDGQGFMVPRNHGISSALELSGASICVVAGTRAAEVAANYFARNRMRHQLVTSERWQDLVNVYASGGCTALTADLTQLAATRATFASPADHSLLPEIVSKEPIAPTVRTGDDTWFAIVRWVLMALVAAEELQITRDNVDKSLQSPSEDVRRLLGVDSDLGHSLGLGADWATRVVRHVGNYGEIFDRWLGTGSPLKLPRGYNKLWTQGGLMYSVPIR